VRLVEGSYDDAQEEARAVAEAEGRPLIHAFADPDVVAGQGTIAAEIVRVVPDVDSIVVPLGGGGLVSGIAIGAKAALPAVRVIGVQAEACSPYPKSIAAHRPIGARSARTIADGIAVKRPAELTLRLVERYVDDVVTVSDDEIAQTMVHLVERSKLVVEGAGAAAAAALEHRRVEVSREGPCCVVLSGGNLDASLLVECIRMGETVAGRRSVLKTVVPDRPGALARLLRIVADRGANVIDVAHLREGVDLHVRETLIRLVIQTSGPEHAAEVADAIRADGFSVEVER
jgi:threonine dehydratase